MNIFIFIIYIYISYIYDTCIHIVYTYNTWTKYVRFLLLVAFEAEDSFERSEASQMDRDATRWGSWESYRFSAVFFNLQNMQTQFVSKPSAEFKRFWSFFCFQNPLQESEETFLKGFLIEDLASSRWPIWLGHGIIGWTCKCADRPDTSNPKDPHIPSLKLTASTRKLSRLNRFPKKVVK